MLKNVVSNWLLLLINIGVTYVLLPFNLHALGQEQYGVWLLVSSMTGYLGLLLLGIPMASVRYITRYVTEKNYDEMNAMIANCGVMYLAMGAASMVVGGVLLVVYRQLYTVPPALVWPSEIAFVCIVFNISVGFFSQLPYGIMAAHHDFVARNLVLSCTTLTKLALMVIFVIYHPSLVSLAVAQICATFFDAVTIWVVVKRRHPQVKLQLSRFHTGVIKSIFSFSVFVLVLQIGNQLSFQTDSLVIGKRLKIDMIPFYAVANSLTTYTVDFVVGIAAVVMPMATRLQTENRTDELQRIFLRWSKIAFSLALLSSLCFFAIGPSFIGRWMGPSFLGPSGEVLRILVLSNIFFLPIRGVALPVLMGLGQAGRPTIAFLTAGVLNLVLSLIWAGPWGLAGVAWGTAVPNIAFALTILFIVCAELKLPLRRYLSYVVERATLGAIPVAALLYWIVRTFVLQTYLRQAVAAFAGAGLFGLVWLVYVLRNDPNIDVYSKLNTLLPSRWRLSH